MIDANKYLKRLFDPSKWDQLPHHEVNRQFHHNLSISSAYVDELTKCQQSLQARDMFSFLNV